MRAEQERHLPPVALKLRRIKAERKAAERKVAESPAPYEHD
jgi:hypothetical protein